MQKETLELLKKDLPFLVLLDLLLADYTLEKIAEKYNFEIIDIYNLLLNEYKEEWSQYQAKHKNQTIQIRIFTRNLIIKELLMNRTVNVIATKYKLSYYVVFRDIKYYSLESLLPVLKRQMTNADLKTLTLDLHFSDKLIAKIYKTQIRTVSEERRKYQIKNKDIAEKRKKDLSYEIFEKLYIEMGISISQIAEITNLQRKTISGIKQKYGDAFSFTRKSSVNEIMLAYARKKYYLQKLS